MNYYIYFAPQTLLNTHFWGPYYVPWLQHCLPSNTRFREVNTHLMILWLKPGSLSPTLHCSCETELQKLILAQRKETLLFLYCSKLLTYPTKLWLKNPIIYIWETAEFPRYYKNCYTTLFSAFYWMVFQHNGTSRFSKITSGSCF